MKLGNAIHIVRGVLNHDETVDFYKNIGYKILHSDTTPTKFTLFTDGIMNLLISEDNVTYTGLIYFDEDQTARVKFLENSGISFFWKQEDNEKVNQAMFEIIPGKFGINLVSAKYNKEHFPDGNYKFPLGMFGEFAIPVNNFDETASFLENIGFDIKGKYSEPYMWGILQDGQITLGLHQSEQMSMNIPTYYSIDSHQVLKNLEQKGIDVEYLGEKNGMIVSPDGQQIYVFNATEEQIQSMTGNSI